MNGPNTDFTILGAGALGSILGAHLTRAGRSVVMLAREPRAKQIERDGLRITGLEEFSTPAAVLRDSGHLQSAGVLIVAMKTPGTRAALEALRHARIGVALSIQNGLLKNDLLAQVLGPSAVLGALANVSGEMRPDGTVLFTRNEGIYLGEATGGPSARVRGIVAALEESGIRAAARPDIASLEWSKFCAWIGLAALSITTRALTWRYLSDPDSALMVLRLVRETGALAHASGIELSDESVLPVATLCTLPEGEALAALREVGAEFRARAPQHRMSCLQDLEAGRELEVEETFGDAHRRAERLGLSLPLLEAFYRLMAASNRMRSPDRYSQDTPKSFTSA